MGSYGTSTWGGLSIATSIVRAYALGPKLILVEFDNPPTAVSRFIVGDTLNPFSWTVTNRATGDTLLVCGVEQQTTTQFRVQVTDEMGDQSTTHRIQATGIRSLSGVLLLPPRYVDFLGVTTEAGAFPISRRRPTDLRAAPASGNLAWAGLVVGANGDYMRESGVALARKLIYRRIVTPRGGFIRWKTFGLGLGSKNYYNPAALIQLRAEIIRELEKEPDFSDIRVTLTLKPTGVLEVSVSVQIPGHAQAVLVVFPVPGVQVR